MKTNNELPHPNETPRSKESSSRLSAHFSQVEFACKCCGRVKVNPKLIVSLETLRERCGNRPILVRSGYRCPRHNKAVGGAINSQHLVGGAADIAIEGMSPVEIAYRAVEIPAIRGIGLGEEFLHLDVRTSHRAVWGYTPGGGRIPLEDETLLTWQYGESK
jgi:uncharacterized protein YcbK (DUF882 family)